MSGRRDVRPGWNIECEAAHEGEDDVGAGIERGLTGGEHMAGRVFLGDDEQIASQWINEQRLGVVRVVG